jgi:hypothetical protein
MSTDSPFSPPFDAVSDSLRLAIETSGANDLKILGLLDHVADRLSGHDADVQELREGLAALSNRLEALTQAGLHSVKA